VRDIALTLFIAGMLPVILVRPAIGTLMWVWISMMNPHTLTYGFAATVPWALIIALTTMIGFVFTKDKRPFPVNGGTILIGLLLAWMTVTSLFALNPDPGEVFDRWVFALKILLMLMVTFVLLRGRKEIDWLLWALVISVGFYGVKGGLWTLVTGGGGRVWGPPGGTLADNNSLAVGLVIQLPWIYYLREVSSRRWLRFALACAFVLIALGVLGTQSRGAFLAVLGMAVVVGLKGKRFFRTSLSLLVVGVAAFVFMPDSWIERMDTIHNYEGDTSAVSRLWTWATLWNAALDRPFVGAGFRADNWFIFMKYAPVDVPEELRNSYFVAHSIYFQALGEHGFVGLGIYLGLGLWTWFAASRLAASTRDDPEFSSWVPLLMRMTQASLVGFAIGGAFLSLMLLDLSFYIPGIVVLVSATVRERRRAETRPTLAVPIEAASKGARNDVVPGHTSA
jgi:probable O-glycosylation ligase (exosortase A-associated)